MNLRKLITTVATGASVAALSVAFGANGYTFFGEADYFLPGNASPRAVQMTSDAAPGFGGIDFEVPTGMTFADLNSLGTDYFFPTGEDCGGGSPRFQVAVDNGAGDSGNIFVYIGPPPNYTGCTTNAWTPTGDLLEGVNPIDTSQLSGGTFYDPYATALTKYGTYEVTGIELVTDASWFFTDGDQIARVDNTNIDGTIYTYDPTKDDCKKGGWVDMTDADGNEFKNQGDCVSYFATGGRNPGAIAP